MFAAAVDLCAPLRLLLLLLPPRVRCLRPPPHPSTLFCRVQVRVYRNTNMKPIKHVTYLRLYALKDSLWHPDVVLQPLVSGCGTGHRVRQT